MRAFLACLALLLVSPALAAETWPSSSMNIQIDQTNFVVNSGCSGTLIDLDQRYILTAAHCVEDQYVTAEREVVDDKGIVSIEKYRKLIDGTVSQILFYSGETTRTTVYRVTLKAVDKAVDLAVVQIVDHIPNFMAAKLADREPKRGDTVWVVGNPAGMLYASLNSGVVSSVQRTYGLINFGNDPHQRLMQVTAGIIGGNSGGSVYNSQGELVGVPVLGNRVNEVIGFAVPLDVIKAFLSANKLN